MSNSRRAARVIRRATSASRSASSLSNSNRSSAQSSGLRRVLGLGFGLAVIVGSTLGIGILRTPGLVAGQLSTPSAILLVWIVVAAFAVRHPSPASSPTASSASVAGLVFALQAVVITYGGWQSALYFSEEDRDPTANIPRSMIGGVAAVIVVYLLINLALLWVLPVPDLARSTLAAADAARVLAGPRGQQIITVLSLVSLPPMLNAIVMIGARIMFAMGRDGLLWRKTAAVGAGGTPAIATLITTAVAVVGIVSGTFQRLVAITAFFLALNYGICCVALVVLRRREPHRARPFVAPGYPWSAYIVLSGAVALVVGTLVGRTVNGGLAIALLIAGLIGRMAVARRGARRSVAKL